MLKVALASVLLGLSLCLARPVTAQIGNSATISGVVVDQTGGVVVEARVTVTDPATGDSFVAMTGAVGSFVVPALRPGAYDVTVVHDGFAAETVTDVVATAGGPASVRIVLRVAGATEAVSVTARGGDLMQRDSPAVSHTLDRREMSNLPVESRNALDFVTALPGVATPAANRASTINGLPRGSINITIDGMNAQDGFLRSRDGFFALVTPRIDAVESVTVTSAATTADQSGQGAVQIRFVTRSGSNTLSGSAYHYFRDDALNATDWFTRQQGLEKPDFRLIQPGARLGGPIVIPGLVDGRGRAFFFVNYEEARQPDDFPRTRTILRPEPRAGRYRYDTAAGPAEIDVLALAAARGFLASPDPVIAQLLADIDTAVGTTGAVTDFGDLNRQRFAWQVERVTRRHYPTGRVDLVLSPNHRLSGIINFNRFEADPDTITSREAQFPDFPVEATQLSHRFAASVALRSTVGPVVNEFRIGPTRGTSFFGQGIVADSYSQPFGGEGGFRLNLGAIGVTSPSGSNIVTGREPGTLLVEDVVNWMAGSHAFNAGVSFTRSEISVDRQTVVPRLDFGLTTGNPAAAMFTAATMPGSSGADRTGAERLYAVLTGHVNAILGDAAIAPNGERYVYLGPFRQEARLDDFGFWIQDTWRPRPDLTVTAGLRYQLQRPFISLNDSYSTTTPADVWGVSGLSGTCTDLSAITPERCNLFRPGLTPGKSPEFIQLDEGTRLFDTDRNNLAPSLGVAWTPTRESGWLADLLGQPGDTVLRAGFSRAFNQPGMNDFTGRLDDNPGVTIGVNRFEFLGNLPSTGLLLRQPETLGPPDFDRERVYPLTQPPNGDIQAFDPHLRVPYADTWSAGWQRAVGRNTALEVRYVGTRSRGLWTTYDLNELNIIENEFLDEFKLAQANLRANLDAGRGATFRYAGPGTGTVPLPIFLAFFSGIPAAQASDAARYTSGLFGNNTFINPLAVRSPDPFGAARGLFGAQARRANAVAAGLPANFFVANPEALGGAEIDGNGPGTDYHSLQVDLRRRYANGFQFRANYTYGRAYADDFISFRLPWRHSLSDGTSGGVRHALKASWLFEIPVGRGRRFAANAGPVLDALVGGWALHGIARVQSGRIVDFGNVRMVGFDLDDLRRFYRVRVDGEGRVWMLPDDVIENTMKAFSTSATSADGYGGLGPPEGRYFAPASGPDCTERITPDAGECGEGTIEAQGPRLTNVDLAVVKVVPMAGRVRAEFRFEILNAFNATNFLPVANLGAALGAYEVRALTGVTEARTIQIASRVSW